MTKTWIWRNFIRLFLDLEHLYPPKGGATALQMCPGLSNFFVIHLLPLFVSLIFWYSPWIAVLTLNMIMMGEYILLFHMCSIVFYSTLSFSEMLPNAFPLPLPNCTHTEPLKQGASTADHLLRLGGRFSDDIHSFVFIRTCNFFLRLSVLISTVIWGSNCS